MTYLEKLQDPRWISRRCEVMQSRGGKCQECERDRHEAGPLQVHHVTYLRNVQPWDYPDDLLRLICRECHFERQIQDEEAMVEFARLLNRMDWQHVRSIAKMVRGCNQPDSEYPLIFDALKALRGEPSVARQRRVLT